MLLTVKAPKSILVTVNAGVISKDHWTQDPLKGGGRIIGECCLYRLDEISGWQENSIRKWPSDVFGTCQRNHDRSILYNFRI